MPGIVLNPPDRPGLFQGSSRSTRSLPTRARTPVSLIPTDRLGSRSPTGDDLQLRALTWRGEGRRRVVRQDRTVPGRLRQRPDAPAGGARRCYAVAAVFSALNQPFGLPAWKSIRSWYVLGTIDKIIPSAEQLFMAQRMHAHITRVRAGHLSMVSKARLGLPRHRGSRSLAALGPGRWVCGIFALAGPRKGRLPDAADVDCGRAASSQRRREPCGEWRCCSGLPTCQNTAFYNFW